MTIATGQQALASDVLNIAKSKILAFTRDLAAVSGDVAYTGFGFKPRALIILAGYSAQGQSTGVGDVNAVEACVYANYNASAHGISTSQIIHVGYANDDTSGQYAVLKSIDSDGFTLTWTKYGSPPSASISIIVLATQGGN